MESRVSSIRFNNDRNQDLYASEDPLDSNVCHIVIGNESFEVSREELCQIGDTIAQFARGELSR